MHSWLARSRPLRCGPRHRRRTRRPSDPALQEDLQPTVHLLGGRSGTRCSHRRLSRRLRHQDPRRHLTSSPWARIHPARSPRIRRQLDIATESAFYQAIANNDIGVIDLTAADWTRIAGLLDTYTDIGLDAADASVIAVAERLNQTVIATLDERDFRIVHALPVRCPGTGRYVSFYDLD